MGWWRGDDREAKERRALVKLARRKLAEVDLFAHVMRRGNGKFK